MFYAPWGDEWFPSDARATHGTRRATLNRGVRTVDRFCGFRALLAGRLVVVTSLRNVCAATEELSVDGCVAFVLLAIPELDVAVLAAPGDDSADVVVWSKERRRATHIMGCSPNIEPSAVAITPGSAFPELNGAAAIDVNDVVVGMYVCDVEKFAVVDIIVINECLERRHRALPMAALSDSQFLVESSLAKRPFAKAWLVRMGEWRVYATNITGMLDAKFATQADVDHAVAAAPLEALDRHTVQTLKKSTVWGAAEYLVVGHLSIFVHRASLAVRGSKIKRVVGLESLHLSKVDETSVKSLDDVVEAVRNADETLVFAFQEGPTLTFQRAELALGLADVAKSFYARGVSKPINSELASVGVLRVGRSFQPLVETTALAVPPDAEPRRRGSTDELEEVVSAVVAPLAAQDYDYSNVDAINAALNELSV